MHSLKCHFWGKPKLILHVTTRNYYRATKNVSLTLPIRLPDLQK
jgi:hypothetical protein